MGGFQNSHQVYAPKINVFYADLGEYMQLCFLKSTMPKLKISSIIPMYIHIFFPDLKSISQKLTKLLGAARDIYNGNPNNVIIPQINYPN